MSNNTQDLLKLGDIVQHINPDCPNIGGVEGKIVWMDASQTFCDVLFNLPLVMLLPHPHLNEHYRNRINDPCRLPTRLLKKYEATTNNS
jgi:hypothetical protein